MGAAASDRTMVTLALGIAGVVVLASGAQASRPAAPPSTRPKLPVPKKPAPKGSVTVGPVTQYFTDPKTGVVTTRTTSEEDEGPTRIMPSAAEQKKRVLEAAKSQQPKQSDLLADSHDLLTDEQWMALESEAIERARAAEPNASQLQQERARAAAIKARSMLRDVPPIPPLGSTPPPRTKAVPDDWDMLAEAGEALPYRDAFDDAPPAPKPKATPKPYVSPPSPINLELARKEAPALAQHIRTKGKNFSKQALKDFQRHAGMTVDGIYGPMSVDALKIFGVANPPPSLVKTKPK